MKAWLAYAFFLVLNIILLGVVLAACAEKAIWPRFLPR
jgi:hypothetical protein